MKIEKQVPYKVDMSKSQHNNIGIWILVFGWYVFRCGSKNTWFKICMFERDLTIVNLFLAIERPPW
jgi:ammonia channel protein AmtB